MLRRFRAHGWRSQASPGAKSILMLMLPRLDRASPAAGCALFHLGKSSSRKPRSPSTRSTAPAGPSPSRSITLPPAGCPSIIDAIKYCKASRSRDSGTGTVAVHVPTRRNRISRTAAIEDSSWITLRIAGASAVEKASGPACSASRYSRINWIMAITLSVCCRAAATLSCCCSAASSIESSSEQRKLVSGWHNECSNSPSTSGPRGSFQKKCGARAHADAPSGHI